MLSFPSFLWGLKPILETIDVLICLDVCFFVVIYDVEDAPLCSLVLFLLEGEEIHASSLALKMRARFRGTTPISASKRGTNPRRTSQSGRALENHWGCSMESSKFLLKRFEIETSWNGQSCSLTSLPHTFSSFQKICLRLKSVWAPKSVGSSAVFTQQLPIHWDNLKVLKRNNLLVLTGWKSHNV